METEWKINATDTDVTADLFTDPKDDITEALAELFSIRTPMFGHTRGWQCHRPQPPFLIGIQSGLPRERREKRAR